MRVGPIPRPTSRFWYETKSVLKVGVLPWAYGIHIFYRYHDITLKLLAIKFRLKNIYSVGWSMLPLKILNIDFLV